MPANHFEWLKKAHDDFLSAKSILTHKDGAPSGVCFLSQQMAEKHLKALLAYYHQPIPKIHDLLLLETRLTKYESQITKLHQPLIILNRYYIETRYPGDYPEFTWRDAEQAFTAAEKVKSFMESKFRG